MRRDFISGMFFSFVGKGGNFIVNLIVTMILSRILTPEEFGTVAIVQVFLLFFQIISEAGLGPAIIQNNKLSDRDNQILFSFSLIFSLIVTILFIISGFIAERLYYTGLIKYFAIASLGVFLSCAATVPFAVLSKKKQFRAVNMTNIIATIIGGTIGVAASLLGFGAMTIIIMFNITWISNFILKYRLVFLPPSKKLEKNVLMKVLDFSLKQYSFNLLNYFSKNLDNLIIGRISSAQVLGYYSKAYQLTMYPSNLLTPIFTNVFLPIFSEHQNNMALIREKYLKIWDNLLLLAIPISFLLSISSREVIYVVFGNQWSGAIAPFKWLSLGLFAQILMQSNVSIFQTVGRLNFINRIAIVQLFGTIFAVLLGIWLKGIEGVAQFLLFTWFLTLILSIIYCSSVIGSSVTRMLKSLLITLVIAGISSLFVEMIKNLDYINSFGAIIVRSLIFSIVFSISSFILGLGELKGIRNKVYKLIRK